MCVTSRSISQAGGMVQPVGGWSGLPDLGRFRALWVDLRYSGEELDLAATNMGMTDTQLYFAVGLPVFAVILNIVAGMMQHNATMARFTSMDNRFSSMENRFTHLETRMEARFSSLEARFEMLTGKVIEIDNRLERH